MNHSLHHTIEQAPTIDPQRVLQSVCVYCGASPGILDAYRQGAQALAQTLVKRNIRLVFGGGHVGLMGIIADAVMQAGGTAIGVIPQALVDRELAHHTLTELHIVANMHERKKMMADLSDGFIAMPGGIGTFEELFETWTWSQLDFHNKPLGLFNIAGFYDPLLNFLDNTVAQGFLKPAHRDLLKVEQDPVRLLDRLANLSHADDAAWLKGQSQF